MIDLETLTGWFGEMGWAVSPRDAVTLRVTPPTAGLPPFYVRLSEHWLMLAMTPVVPATAARPPDLARRLLAVNRDMRLAKFAYDEDHDVQLAAELPTESLDFSEVREAAERIVRYAGHYRSYLTQGTAP